MDHLTINRQENECSNWVIILDILAGQSPGDDGITCYYFSNWSEVYHRVFFFFFSFQEREENEIPKKKEGNAQGYIRPIQSIVLQPFETFWMDWEMMAISPQTKNQQRAKKIQSIVLWNGSPRSSLGSASRGLLELLLMRNGERSTDKHTQPKTADSQVPLASPQTVWVDLRLGESTTVRAGREQNNDHMSSSVQPRGDWLVNISLGLELNSFQMKTYILYISLKVGLYHMCMFINKAASLFGYT